ncbi:PREDICTED: olfactory receptor 18-like [Elephantulus edwardii]|uniref:olfactory receptor 18-like n=1 Tax=Elephantulus edwardii TaxID=28737 RepID=UPI0003F0ED94|nr:PREDICTED: olfactory receptor 18-like [Elephantulus edwardii]
MSNFFLYDLQVLKNLLKAQGYPPASQLHIDTEDNNNPRKKHQHNVEDLLKVNFPGIMKNGKIYIQEAKQDRAQVSPYTELMNISHVSVFLLMGLSDDPDLQYPLFGIFFFMYLVTVLGNLFIILAICWDSNLHTPMYFFLGNLSLADIAFTSTIVPKMLNVINTHNKIITYVDCLIQSSLLHLFGCMDSLLLTAMAYDRYVAICRPLHYQTVMNPCVCGLLVLVTFFISLLESQLQCLILSHLTFCTDVEIPSFFCDPSQLLNLACYVTSNNIILVYCIGAIFGGVPVSLILLSYGRIVYSILRVPSAGGKYKAFSTCGSHLSVVCLFYGTAIGVYLSSVISHSLKKGAVASVMYTVVTPMLNPFIYSLRNGDIKTALQRLSSRIVYF